MEPWVALLLAGGGIVIGWFGKVLVRGAKGLVQDVQAESKPETNGSGTHVSHTEVLQQVREFRESMSIEMQTGFARVEQLEHKVENGLLEKTARLEAGQDRLNDKLDGVCERLARMEGKLDAK